MHCLLTAIGSYGDVFPMIGVGARLRAHGHDVTVVTNPYFEAEVGRAGLEYVGVGTAADYERLTLRADLWSPTRGLQVVFREASLGVLEELYATVESHYRPGETVIAAHGLDLASRVAVETLNAPVASVVYAPMALWSDTAPPRMPAGLAWDRAPRWLHRLQFHLGERVYLDRLIRKPLNAFRATHGLPPIQGSYWDWYYGVAPPICLFPDWFVDPNRSVPPDWPAGTVTTGFPFGDSAAGRGEDPLPDGVEAFVSEEPPVVFTPGSGMRFGQRFFAAAVEACQVLGRRGVLLTKYAHQLPERLPENVIAPGFVPLEWLLAHAAAFVHHGGVGSSARGLVAGVPQLVQPMAFDQFDNAWRLRRLGVGDELRRRWFTGPRVAEKLRGLLEDPTVLKSAARWRRECADGSDAVRLALEERLQAQ